MRRLTPLIGWGLFALVALAFGLLFRDQSYLMRVGILALLYGALTVSLNLVNGFTGLFSLGHAAFYGIGAYASALLALRQSGLEQKCWCQALRFSAGHISLQ